MNSTRCRRLLAICSLVCLLAEGRGVEAQLSQTDEDRLQILSDPDAARKKASKDKLRSPFEFFRSQVPPNDVLPFIKPRQWSTLVLEVRANYEDFEGAVLTVPQRLLPMPQEVAYGREVRLVKEQRTRPAFQVMLPRLPNDKELHIDLNRGGSSRPEEAWQAAVQLLPPHQMLILVLSKDANQFSSWSRKAALVPLAAEREDARSLDQLRYYRLVLPMEPDKLALSSHPLTWSTTSHVIWDGLPPDLISVTQQEALLDWLHWGGQLVVIGGAGPTLSIFRDSFLGHLLPAEATGENHLLGESELRPLAQAYPPPIQAGFSQDPDRSASFLREDRNILVTGKHGYLPPAPITPAGNRPVFLAGLKPMPGSSTIPLGEDSPHLLAVERRVGRGRITMLSINPTDPALATWPGIDTLLRRVILRRPEDPGLSGIDRYNPIDPTPVTTGLLHGPDLSWYRVASRDYSVDRLETPERGPEDQGTTSTSRPMIVPRMTRHPGQGVFGSAEGESEDALTNHMTGVAEWRDTAPVPRLCRDLLEQASGISIPSSDFVFKVILAYILAVVPLNWLVFRLFVDRRELAWLVVPVMALGFAVGVERMAAYDLGYDSACDEIDLLEVQGDYPRAHLSRFASLYSTGRNRYSIAYPKDPTALALPMDNGRSIGGEDITTAIFESYPVPILREYAVQPRSLAMFRAEQMLNLAGPIELRRDGDKRMLVNRSGLELRDATITDMTSNAEAKPLYLGTVEPGGTVDLGAVAGRPAPDHLEDFDGPDPSSFLAQLRKAQEDRPENVGELRLVAWSRQPVSGQVFEPALDRHRGFTAVLVHLSQGSPPSPSAPRYNILATLPQEAVHSEPKPRAGESTPSGKRVRKQRSGQNGQSRTVSRGSSPSGGPAIQAIESSLDRAELTKRATRHGDDEGLGRGGRDGS